MFVAQPLKDGGLQFNSFEIGTALSITGFVQLFAQQIIWPFMEHRMSNAKVVRYASLIMLIFSVLMPTCADYARFIVTNDDGVYTPEQKSAVFWLLLTVLSGKTIASVLGKVSLKLGYIPVIILVNNSCPKNGSLGTVHGWGQISANLVRSAGVIMEIIHSLQ